MKKLPGISEKIFAGCVTDPKHERAGERAPDAAGAADRDDEQKKHKINDGKARRQAEELYREPAAETRPIRCRPRTSS